MGRALTFARMLACRVAIPGDIDSAQKLEQSEQPTRSNNGLIACFDRSVMTSKLKRTTPLLPLVAIALVACLACSGSAPSGDQPSQTPTAASSEPDRVDLDAIFPPGPGRDLLLNNCQTCHVWVPIVILQMDQNAWRRNSLEHRDRVEALSDEDFKVLYDYLSSTFTPDRPVPKLPQGLLEAWTSY